MTLLYDVLRQVIDKYNDFAILFIQHVNEEESVSLNFLSLSLFLLTSLLQLFNGFTFNEEGDQYRRKKRRLADVASSYMHLLAHLRALYNSREEGVAVPENFLSARRRRRELGAYGAQRQAGRETGLIPHANGHPYP